MNGELVALIRSPLAEAQDSWPSRGYFTSWRFQRDHVMKWVLWAVILLLWKLSPNMRSPDNLDQFHTVEQLGSGWKQLQGSEARAAAASVVRDFPWTSTSVRLRRQSLKEAQRKTKWFRGNLG